MSSMPDSDVPGYTLPPMPKRRKRRPDPEPEPESVPNAADVDDAAEDDADEMPAKEVVVHERVPAKAKQEPAKKPVYEASAAIPLSSGYLPVPEVPGFSLKRTSAVVGLRVDADIQKWWKAWLQVNQGLHGLPDGVLPAVTMDVIMENLHEILRRSILEVHGVDIGPAPPVPPSRS